MSTARFSLSTPVLLYSKCRLEAPPPCAKGYRDSGASTPRVRSRTRTSRTGIRSCFPRKLFCRHVRSPKRWSRRRLSFRRARHRTLRREIRIAEGNLQIKDDREKRIPPSCWIVQMRKGVWHNIPLRTSGVAKFALHNFSETRISNGFPKLRGTCRQRYPDAEVGIGIRGGTQQAQPPGDTAGEFSSVQALSLVRCRIRKFIENICSH